MKRLSAILVTLLLVLSISPAAAQDEQVYLYMRINPSAVYSDNPVLTVEVYTSGKNIKNVWAYWREKTFILKDDGVAPDKIAGDGVYTGIVDLTGEKFSFSYFWNSVSANMILGVKIELTNGEIKEYEGARFSVVKAGVKFPVVKLGDGLYATQYAFFIVDEKGEIFPDFPLDDIYCGKIYPEAYKKLYSVFPDVFDFITLMPAGTLYRKSDYRENVPYFVRVKNDVKNIGLPIFNDAAKYGSAGRLRGVIYHSYGYGSILDHEIGHAWGINIGQSLGLVTSGQHWIANSDIYCQMTEFYLYKGNYYKFIDNGDGTFKAVRNIDIKNLQYAPLTLYVMGLLPPEEVPPIHVLEGELDFTDLNRVKPEKIREVTIWDIIKAEGGERDPPYDTSQKNFTMAFIIVKPEKFTPAEYAFFSLVSKFYGSREKGEHYLTPFYTATGGRGTMNTTLPITIPTFKINVEKLNLKGYRGEETKLKVEVQPVHGYHKTVQISVEGLPSNFQTSVNPPSSTPPFTSIIRIQIPDEAHGTYTFNVVAYSPEYDWTEKVEGISLRIPWGDIQVLCDTYEKKIEKTGETSFTLRIEPVEGFKGDIKLDVVDAPAEITVTSNPETGTPPFTATINVKTYKTTPIGKHCFKLVITGNGIKRSLDLCVEVYETAETKEKPVEKVEEAKLEIKEIYIYLAVLLIATLTALIIFLKRKSSL